MQGEPAMCENNRQVHWETQHCVINICYHNRGRVGENTQKSPVSPNPKRIPPPKWKKIQPDETSAIRSFAETLCAVQLPSYSKACRSHQAPTSSGQCKTIIMADSQSISPTAKPAIYLCFQII